MNLAHDPGQLTRLDLNLFRLFDTIYRERNLTRAAEQLSLSQSAVSHALERLRRQLGDPLFQREAQGVIPTPLAIRLWPDVQKALASLRLAVIRSQSFDPARDISQAIVAMNDEVEPAIFPALAAELNRRVPETSVASVRLDRSTLRADLASGRIDCAIDVMRPVEEDLLHSFLIEDDFVVVARSPISIDAGAYLSASHVTVSSRPSGRGIEDVSFARQGVVRRVAVRCQHYAAACRIVAESDLLLTMPRRLAMIVAGAAGAHVSALPVPLPGVALHLYWYRDHDAEPGNRWLRATVVDAVSGYSGTSRNEAASASQSSVRPTSA